MSKRLLRALLAMALMATMVLAWRAPPTGVHPMVEILVPGHDAAITIKTAFAKKSSLADCEALTGNVVRVTLERCPNCRIVASRCDMHLSPEAAKLLGAEPLAYPTGRLRNGAMSFIAEDATLAQQACDAADRSTVQSANPVTCQPAGQPRTQAIRPVSLGLDSLLLPLTAALAAWFVGWFILRYDHLHAHLTHDAVVGGPQKHHDRPTPRIGGVQIVAGLLAGWLLLSTWAAIPGREIFSMLLVCAMPAFTGGLVEDVTKKVGVVERLLMTMLTGALACWLLGAVVGRIDVPLIDPLLTWLPLAIAFTCFAVGGIANSINIIDGFHGLASGVTIIMSAAVAYMAWLVGDSALMSMALTLLGAIVGFFVWNWPRGLIFLGDGGAYLIGALIAEFSILLVVRHPEISPWLPVLILSHPIVETVFSMARRIFSTGAHVGGADGDHLHQRVFRRLYGADPHSAGNNHRVAKFFWIATTISALAATFHSFNSAPLMFLAGSYMALYIVLYALTTSSRTIR
jgi:UDP-N-acetylmuramyl pentapeptide phosphotransferase/UDP-N-acetylglucosamine-1-phosphate transferase